MKLKEKTAVFQAVFLLVSTNKPPAMLVEPKSFSFKLKKKTS